MSEKINVNGLEINGIELTIKQSKKTLKKLGSDIVESGEASICLLFILDTIYCDILYMDCDVTKAINNLSTIYRQIPIIEKNIETLFSSNSKIKKIYNNIINITDNELMALEYFEFKKLKVDYKIEYIK